MAGPSNIIKPGFSQCSAIYYGSLPIAQVYKGGTLIWEKTSGGVWNTIDGASYAYFYAYTPASNINVASFALKMSDVNMGYSTNWMYGIYTLSGTTATPVTGACSFGNWIGVSFVSQGTYLDKTMYLVSKSYSEGSRPSLTSGTTYYFVLGERYSAPSPYYVLSGNRTAKYTDGWRMSDSGTFDVVYDSSDTFYMEVIAE